MKTRLLPLILFAIGLVACTDDIGSPNAPKERVDIKLTAEERQVNDQVQTFSFDFLRTLAKERNNPEIKNYVYSPLGVSYVMGMVLNGADGDTYSQIQKALGFEGMDTKSINLYMQTMGKALAEVDNTTVFYNANSIWMAKGINFLPDFKQTNQTYFDATLKEDQTFDAKCADAINAWCKEKTEGMIPEFVKPDEIGNLKALLLNALYFKGIWKDPFEPSQTQMQVFVREDGSPVRVPMMKKKETLQCVSTDEVVIVSLPYGNGAFNMQLMIPADQQVSIDEMLAGLTAGQWNSWMRQEKKYMADLSLPKFDIDYEDKKIKRIMQKLGVKDAFEPNANFSKMSNANLLINWIKQRVTIHVDESGTEATSTSGVGMGEMADISTPLKVDFNRPFAFFITETSTKAVLFAGKVGDPIVK